MKVPIKSIEELKELAQNEDFECQLVLNGGLISRKYIKFDPEYGYWYILNFIDDSEFEYENDKEFEEDYPLFFEALRNRALIYENEEDRIKNYM
jgi:hypothetical protein